MAAGKVDYGLDSPRSVKAMFSRGGWTLAFAIALFYINHAEYPAVSARLLAVLGTIGAAFLAAGFVMVWSSRVAKLQMRDQMLDFLALKGEERVLDVGCGTGLMPIGAAKRLKSGRVTSLDYAGDSAVAKENAKLEGVFDKIRIEAGDPEKLVYPDGHYDAVVSALALHQLGDREARLQAVREMWRVLKPGGRLAIFDVWHTGEYAGVLRSAGAQSVEVSPLSFLWCVPSRSVMTRK